MEALLGDVYNGICSDVSISGGQAQAKHQVIASSPTHQPFDEFLIRVRYRGKNQIDVLDLTSERIAVNASIALARSFGGYPLRRLILAGNMLRDVGIQPLVKLITGSQSLKSIDLSGNDISDSGASMLGQCLGDNPVLEELNLGVLGQAFMASGYELSRDNHEVNQARSHNAIGPVGIRGLVAKLSQNTHLLRLSIAGSTISSVSDSVMPTLCEAVASSAVEELDLSEVVMDESSARYLAQELPRLGLRRLSLRQASITSSSARLIMDAASRSPLLTHVILSDNPFDLTCAADIGRALANAQALRAINISGTGIGETGFILMAAALIKGATERAALVERVKEQQTQRMIEAQLNELRSRTNRLNSGRKNDENEDESKGADPESGIEQHNETESTGKTESRAGEQLPDNLTPTPLVSLSVCKIGLEDQGGIALEKLLTCPALVIRRLAASHNPLGINGAYAIARALDAQTESAFAIQRDRDSQRKNVDMTASQIFVATVEIPVAQASAPLHSLQLCDCRLGGEGLLELARASSQHPALCELILRGNYAESTLAKAITDQFLQARGVLSTIDLEACSLPVALVRSVYDAAQRRGIKKQLRRPEALKSAAKAIEDLVSEIEFENQRLEDERSVTEALQGYIQSREDSIERVQQSCADAMARLGRDRDAAQRRLEIAVERLAARQKERSEAAGEVEILQAQAEQAAAAAEQHKKQVQKNLEAIKAEFAQLKRDVGAAAATLDADIDAAEKEVSDASDRCTAALSALSVLRSGVKPAVSERAQALFEQFKAEREKQKEEERLQRQQQQEEAADQIPALDNASEKPGTDVEGDQESTVDDSQFSDDQSSVPGASMTPSPRRQSASQSVPLISVDTIPETDPVESSRVTSRSRRGSQQGARSTSRGSSRGSTRTPRRTPR